MSVAGRTDAWLGICGCVALMFRSQKPDRFAVFSEGVNLQNGDHAPPLLLQLWQRQYTVAVCKYLLLQVRTVQSLLLSNHNYNSVLIEFVIEK